MALVLIAACSTHGSDTSESNARTGEAASAILPNGSTFESNDGNLVVDAAGKHDWNDPVEPINCGTTIPNAGTNCGTDLTKDTSDNSFGQGSKEDDPTPTVVSGSIPPQKSDLTRFYVNKEQNRFLYLAWERSNVLGSANMDFEFNQNRTPGSNGVTPNRTKGDILITFDFTQGGGTPVLGLLKWLVGGTVATGGDGATKADCFSANALPCWGIVQSEDIANGGADDQRLDLSAAGFAEGAVNTGNVVDTNPPNNPTTLPGLTFGEAGIDLVASGVFSSATCTHFGSAFLKSRSSASFTAEMKDFIAPIPVDIANCATINITKITENGTGTFGYTTTGGLNPATFNLTTTSPLVGVTRSYTDASPGTYTVTESTIPSGWTLKSLTCTCNSSSCTSSQVSIAGAKATITVVAGDTVSCTYTNHTNLSPSISTVLVPSSVTVGGSVHDTATLSGATANAGGTVTYTVYSDTGCSQGARDAGTVTVTNGVVPDSNTLTFPTAGDFFWQAVYSGDANNNPATSVCTSEHLVVNKAQSGLTTTPTLIPNDTAHLTGLVSGLSTGTITFDLFPPGNTNCSGSPAFSQTISSVSTNGDYSTTNTAFVASTLGTWRWKVTYSGDANNQGSSSPCGQESFTLSNP